MVYQQKLQSKSWRCKENEFFFQLKYVKSTLIFNFVRDSLS